MQPIEYSGIWWLPNNPQNKEACKLAFNNESGIALELIGALGDIYTFDNRKPHQLILGITGEGKQVTLTKCSATGVSVGMPGFSRESYKPSLCLIGAHFDDPAKVLFDRLVVKYSYLSDWVQTSGFEIKRSLASHKIEVSYFLPDDIEAKLSIGEVSVSFICNTTGDGIEKIHLNQSVQMEVIADQEYSFSDLSYRYIRPLRNLLSLATTKPNTIIELFFFSKQAVFENGNGEMTQSPIQAFFQQAYFREREERLLIPHSMLFTLHDMIDDFRTVLERWFNLSNELDSVCNLFFGVQSRPELNLENKFLNVVQAVETYHRRRVKNEVLPKAEHKRKKREVLRSVPAEYQEWLKGLLAYSNEPRLEHRIREILEKAHDAIAPVIIDKESFARRVKDTRNYFTHYDRRLLKRAARGEELFWLTQKLSYLLQACLLLELGFPMQKCAQLLQRNQSFTFLMGQSQPN